MNKIKRPAIYRAAEELKVQYPDSIVSSDTASFAGGAIALDFGARLLYCRQLGLIEIISDFTPKADIIAKITNLIQRLESQHVVQALLDK